MNKLKKDIAAIIPIGQQLECPRMGFVDVGHFDEIHTNYNALHGTQRNIVFVVDSEQTGEHQLRLWLECVQSRRGTTLLTHAPDKIELRRAGNTHQTVTFACDRATGSRRNCPSPYVVVIINSTQQLGRIFFPFLANADAAFFVCDPFWAHDGFSSESLAALFKPDDHITTYITRRQ